MVVLETERYLGCVNGHLGGHPGEHDVVTAGVYSPHFRSPQFDAAFAKLPGPIKDLARNKFRMMVQDPRSVPIRKTWTPGVYSVTISDGPNNSYRALAVKWGSKYQWYWIGTHQEYDRVVYNPPPKNLRLPQQAIDASGL